MPGPKPKIFVSSCLGFAACRWNGVTIPDKFVDALKSRVEFVAVCPEADIGLGVPRDPIRIVLKNKEPHLMQPATGRDVSVEMKEFSRKLLDSLKDVDGFILKSSSPSCGIIDVNIYSSIEAPTPISIGSGFFAAEVLKRFGHLPIMTESDLADRKKCDDFLARIGA